MCWILLTQNMLKSVLFVAGGDEYIERQIHQQLLQLSIPVTDVRGVVGLWLNDHL